MPGTLFVVATPIGNLEDITVRALRILREVAVIAAEDTRRTAQLLARHAIATPTTSLHEHNEAGKSAALVERLLKGDSIALVSDAGTPTVSDPGGLLIRAAIDAADLAAVAVDVVAVDGAKGGLPEDPGARAGELSGWARVPISTRAASRGSTVSLSSVSTKRVCGSEAGSAEQWA